MMMAIVTAGALQVDGVQPQSPVHVNSGARLQGSGIVGHINFNGSSGVVAPGANPGLLTCSNFNGGAIGSGTLQVELSGTTPGSGYDQLNVRGSVTLSNINLNASLNYPSAASDQFVIINNDGADAIMGTFNGLAQDAKLYLGGELFQISYTGGTGNDVVLTRLVTPPKPALTIQRVSPAFVRLLWPTNDPAYALQYNTNLTTTDWQSTATASTTGTNYVVTNTAIGKSRLYRLAK
jgi:hypothetical protein